jgi:GDP-L-fucose synthase
MKKNSKIFVAGHNGLVGSALIRQLTRLGYKNIATANKDQLDLTDKVKVQKFFDLIKPEYVFLSAAKVGGINFNKNFPADFIRDNIEIQTNVIDSAYRYGSKKLLFLGSACIYPKITPQPIKEEYLLTDLLEPTNEAYAIAKILGLKMCQMYSKQYGFNAISLMPTNLYGPNDNFNIQECHVIPGMINKFLFAKENGNESVVLWGDGTPTRQFMHSEDLADACIFLMNTYDNPEIINVSSDVEYTIKDLAKIVKQKLQYTGEIIWDTNKPNGTPKRSVCVEKLSKLGWYPKIKFEDGLSQTIDWFMNNRSKFQ